MIMATISRDSHEGNSWSGRLCLYQELRKSFLPLQPQCKRPKTDLRNYCDQVQE